MDGHALLRLLARERVLECGWPTSSAPLRRIGLSAAYANAGLQRLSLTETGEGNRYYAVGINGSWTF